MCLCAWESKVLLLCTAIWMVRVPSKNSLESLNESSECCKIVHKQAVQHGTELDQLAKRLKFFYQMSWLIMDIRRLCMDQIKFIPHSQKVDFNFNYILPLRVITCYPAALYSLRNISVIYFLCRITNNKFIFLINMNYQYSSPNTPQIHFSALNTSC